MVTATTTDTLALNGGPPAITQRPAWPICGEQEQRWMQEVLASGKWSNRGLHELAFCEEFARFIGTRHSLLLANGTVTLQCALQAVGVRPGDEVVVPGLTWVATAQAAFDIGATVVFADVDPQTLCLDAGAFAAAITPRTRAVIPVHLYGCMVDMDAILAIARSRGIRVVEDVAHQHGSRWRDRCAGALGDCGSFSFQQSKVLTSGEGGAITTDDPGMYETIHCLKHVGWTPAMQGGNRYGHNYRATEMQAVLLRGGLQRLEAQTAHRERSVQRIRRELEEHGGPLRAVARDPRITRQAYYGMTLRYDATNAGGLPRATYLAALAAEGLWIGPPYPPVYRSTLMNLYDPTTSPVPYRDPRSTPDYRQLRLPYTERAATETAVVLGHQHLLGDDAHIDAVLQAIDKVDSQLSMLRAAAIPT